MKLIEFYKNYKKHKAIIKAQKENKKRWEAYFKNGMKFEEEVN